MEKTYDILIAGAGASGLAAAIEAGRTDPSLAIALAERDDRVGKKLLVTGNGRCNLCNEALSAEDYTASALAYPGVLEQLGGCEGFFASLGLLTWADGEGRVYPHSNQASAVLNLLRQEAGRLGTEEICGFGIADIRKEGGDFVLTSSDGRTLKGRKLILALGSPAGRKREDNGGLYRQLERLGHPVTPFRPALCPLDTDPDRVRSLKGLRARASVTLERGGREIGSSRGEVQFSDGYLGGICVMDLSVLAEEGDVLSLDLVPDMTGEELKAYLEGRAAVCGTAEQVLSGCLGKALGILVLKDCGIRPGAPASALDGEGTGLIARTAKALRFPVTGTPGTARAQVCLGGVSPGSVDGRTLASRETEGLFFCGELLGVAGRCGGFNLAWAWTSGRIAGRNAAT